MLGAAFLVGSMLGWTLAHVSAQAPPIGAERPLEGVASPRSRDGSGTSSHATGSLPADLWQLSTRIASLESLIDDLESQRADVSALGERAIAAMSDAELSAALMSTVQLSQDELGEVRDIRAFAGRMLEVAMLGVVEADQEVPGTARVSFSQDGPGDVTTATIGGRFPAGSQRIFANFPTPDPERGQVLVKWFRTDRPRILLMQRYPLRPGDRSAYVWLDSEGGWTPGNYQVDVYAADEAVTPLASGRYEIW